MNIFKKALIIIITFISFFSIIFPQAEVEAASDDYRFERITTQEGLSNSFTRCILQDHYGYLWFGTISGLNKYDGVNFKIYKNNATSDNSISSSYIKCIYETRSGQLWIGTEYGLNLFNRQNDTFTSYLWDENNTESISDNSITSIFEDSQGNLWIGTSAGLNCFDTDTEVFTRYLHDDDDSESISGNSITTIFEDSQGNLWIGTSAGLNCFDTDTGVFTIYLHDDDDSESISDNSITAIFEDSQGNLWIGTSAGLNIFNSGSFEVYMINGTLSYSVGPICEDNSGILWVGSGDGLICIDISNGIITQYKADYNDENSIISDGVSSLYKDSEGNLWIGTNLGINKLDFNKQVFSYYVDDGCDQTITGIDIDDNGYLWLEIDGGVMKFNIETSSIEAVFTNIFKNQYAFNYMNNTYCIGADGCIWIATENSGLERFDTETQKTTTYTYNSEDKNSLLSNNVTSIYIDNDGIMWVGTDKGLCSYNPTTGEFSAHNDALVFTTNNVNDEIYVTYQDSEGNLWIGTDTGIYLFDIDNAKVTLAMDNSTVASGTSKTIFCIYEDSNHLLWFGTNFGLYCYSLYDKEFILHGLEDELSEIPDNYILNIVEDDNGYIWLATRQGLEKLSLGEGIYTKYGVADGLGNDNFCVGAICEAEDGEIFLGCLGGLVSFYPDEIEDNVSASKVIISNFSLLDGSITFDVPIEDVNEINLSYSDNSFIIDFVTLNYGLSGNVEYAYKLSGFDEDWNYCDTDVSSAKYTNLNSGKYTFFVIAANSDGVWSADSTSLSITIMTPFWKSWWFILSLCVIAVLGVVMAIKLRTRVLDTYAKKLEIEVEERNLDLIRKTKQLKHANKLLEEELNNRVEFTHALVHELKTPLTPLLSSSEYLVENVEDDMTLGFIKNIRQGILNLEKRINELMDLSRGEVGLIKLHCDFVYPIVIIKECIRYFIPEAQKKNQGIILDLPDTISEIYADEERLKQVILNLLNNASKFTRRGGEITLKALETDKWLEISISDTGCGIDEGEQKYIFEPYSKLRLKKESHSGLGLGLYLSKLFVELHGGKIWVISSKGKGSTFTFTIPLRSTVYEIEQH
jgi:ligand-binding sensor domain-containing protein/signal transduction histidine kinase